MGKTKKHPFIQALSLRLRLLVFLSLLGAVGASAQQINSQTDVVAPVVPLAAMPFPLQNVQLLAGPFYDAMIRDKAYLLSLNADRFLYNYRINYGLPTSATPYGGWDNPGSQQRGCVVGHYLSACSLMYASTGDPQLKAQVDYLVNAFAQCQSLATANGFRSGYLSAFPESYIDTVVTNGPVWAPWYAIHKIMAGLLDAYQLTGNAQALVVLTNEANWVKSRIDPLTTAQIQVMLNTEFGGMGEVLASTYAVTGNTNYLLTAQAFDHQAVFAPLAAQSDQLDPLHVNTQIPKIIAAAREYEFTGSPSYQTIATFFWQRVTQYRSFAIGTPGDNEFFFPTNTFPQHLSASTAETCNAYNLLKLTRYLFALNPSVSLMDYYERCLYNHILASQEPTEGMVTYLMSLKPGHFKTYSTPEDSFWCCVGTGMENHAKYGDTIYFHDSNSLYVNLFIASQLSWPDKGLLIRQDTTFPQTNTALLSFSCTNAVPLTLRIRFPSWAQQGMALTLNGTSLTVTNQPGSYVSVTRTWQTGDQLLIQIPLTFRTEPLPDNTDPNTVVLFDGPILLAGALGTYQMPGSDFAIGDTDLIGVADPLTPVMVGDTNGLIANTIPVSGQPLTFQTKNIGEPYDVTLIPFYQTHHQRYSAYWKLMAPTAWQQQVATLSTADAINVDTISTGDTTSDTAHSLQSSNSFTGVYNGVSWRDARNGGWFSYAVNVASNQPMTLVCTYWGSDTGGRIFDILVNGQIIVTQTLTNNQPGQLFQVQYPIPPNLTTNQSKVTVKFQAHAGLTAGGVFGLQMIKSANPGKLQSISLTTQPAQPAAGGSAYQYANVVANYQNLTNYSIVGSPNLAVLSSDTSVLTVGPNAQLISVNPGTATITANYLGYTASQTITVTSTPAISLPASLQHRYQFNSAHLVNGTNVVDSLNPSNVTLFAILRGNAAITNQQLVLDGSAGTYVDLPSGVISNFNGVTIEAWASFGNEPAWAYLFAFGDTVAGGGQNGFWFTPHSGFNDYRLILSDIPGQANEYRVQQNGFLDGRVNQHLVAVIDLNSSYEALYLNGALVGERNDVPFNQGAIHDIHSYLGKSVFSADPAFIGSVTEFRIYQGRLSAQQIAATDALGPNTTLKDLRLNVQQSRTNLMLNWPTNTAGFNLQSSPTLGPAANWQQVTGTTTLSNGLNWMVLPMTNSATYLRLKF